MPLVSILASVLFVLLHAPRQIGWHNLAVFFPRASAIRWSYESLSFAAGFPFGNHHSDDDLGWKLGTVPLLIMPAHFGVCYISWLIARTLTLLIAPALSYRWPVVLVAAIVLVMWDLSPDPSRAAVNLTWIWHEGGACFGLPLVSFADWSLCVASILAAFGVWLRVQGVAGVAVPDRLAQAHALGLCGGLFAEFVAFTVLGLITEPFTDATGQVWNLRDIYESLGLVSIFTMGFVLVLGIVTLGRSRAA